MSKYLRAAVFIMLVAVLLLCGCVSTRADLVCQVNVSCANAVAYADLDQDLRELQPADGALFDGEIAFTAGETAYDVLTRALQQAKLHYEAAEDGSYFLAVSNLYGGDCGDLSGWMYSVNGEFLMDAVNQYQPQEGDVIALQYTCDMGADLGATF